MTITADLQAVLADSIAKDRKFILGPESITSPPILQMLQVALEGGRLEVSDAGSLSASGDGSSLSFSGKATAFGLAGVELSGTFFVQDDQLALRLAFALPPGWTISRSFPVLAGVSPLDQISFTKAALVLSSVSGTDPESHAPLSAGINLVAVTGLGGPFAAVQALLASDGSVKLAGAISFVENPGGGAKLPNVELSGSLPISVTIGPLAIRDIDIEVDCIVYIDPAIGPAAQFASWVALNGVIQLGRKAADISVVMPTDPASLIRLTAQFKADNSPGLADLAPLLGGSDLEAALPEPLRGATGLRITEMQAGVSLLSKKIQYVSLQLESRTPWQVMGDQVLVSGVEAQVMVIAPGQAASRQFAAYLSGGLIIGGAQLQVKVDLPETTLTAWLVSGQSVTAAKILNHFFPDVTVPASFQSFAISQLQLTANSKFRTFGFLAEIGTQEALSLGDDLAFASPRILSLSLSVEASPGDAAVRFSGNFLLFDKNFSVTVARRIQSSGVSSSSAWIFEARLGANETIRLATVVERIFGEQINAFGLTDLILDNANVAIRRGDNSGYSVTAALTWDTGVSFAEGETLKIHAAVDIHKQGNKPVSGTIGGRVSTSLPFLEHLSLAASYAFGSTNKALKFHLELGELKLDGDLLQGPETKIRFTTSGQKLTFGQILTSLAGLVDPGIEEFHLDPPWDLLDAQELPDITLEINTEQRTVTATCKKNIDLGFISITGIQLTCREARASDGKTTRTVFIGFEAASGSPLSPEPWDALNKPAPPVQGKGRALFDVEYLGLGQHVSLNSDVVGRLETIAQVLDALQGKAKPLLLGSGQTNPLAATGDAIQFNAASGWLIGAKFTLASALDVSLVFNDPLLYGLRIGLRGDVARIFKGLEFEILYRRISDTIGVYHTELTLPDAMRYLNFGPVALTLPVVVLDVFTNGDFKVDFGFPWNNNFERSFAIEILPFVGAGGFYFNKLSAATATSLIQPMNGTFDPIFEFGVGLRIGLGKTFRRGPLLAEITIAVQGTIEGVISWFKETGSSKPPEQYYYLQGSVTVVARIYGEVDFEVISVSVEVIAQATVRFVVEAFEPILLTLTAEVIVNASVKILFINIKFSFSLSVSESFTIGSHTDPPWEIAGGGSPAKNFSRRSVLARPALATAPASLALQEPQPADDSDAAPRNINSAAVSRRVAAPRVATPAASAPTPHAASAASPPPAIAQAGEPPSQQAVPLPKLRWEPALVSPARQSLTLFFQPGYTRSAEGMFGVALLFIENSIEVTAIGHTDHERSAEKKESDFDRLMLTLLRWAIQAAFGLQVLTVSRRDMEAIYKAFTEGDAFDFDNLTQFLEVNFSFQITDCRIATSGTIFPMIPELSLQVGDTTARDFKQRARQLTDKDIQLIRDYFKPLQVRRSEKSIPDHSALGAGAPISVVAFVFRDYFALLIRSALQQAIDRLEDSDQAEIEIARLLNDLNRGGAFNHIAGIASRFLLHGLRLPASDKERAETFAIYSEMGQQFLIPADKDLSKLVITLGKPEGLEGIVFNDRDESGKEVLNAPVLRYLFPPSTVELLGELRALKPQLSEARPEVLSPYADTPLRFPIHRSADWQATFSTGQVAAQHAILDFPENLLRHLETEAASGSSLILKFGETQSSRAELKVRDVRNYTWATRVPVTIRRIPNADGTGSLTDTYLMVGADESGKDRLEDLWIHAGTNRILHLYLLEPNSDADTSQLVNKTAATCTLLKTNLSAIADEPYSATLSEGRDFVRLLWESSRVNTGGYFLHYRHEGNGFSSDIFADGLNATPVLLALLDLPPAPSSPVHSFQNAVVVADRLDLDAGVLFAESAERVKTLTIPPGHIGLRLTRPNASIAAGTPTASTELSNLYHLLSYCVKESSGFRASNEGLPIGPLEDDPATREDDNLWIYERVVPAFSLAKVTPLPDAPGLPPVPPNPYAGVGSDSSISIEFQWQDIYGNRLGVAASTSSYPVRYVDPLIAMNQWPSMTVSYWVTAANESRANLHVRLVFDHQRFIPVAVTDEEQKKDEIAAALATYQQIFYQVTQDDLSFALSTSVIPGGRHLISDEKPRLIRLVGDVCRYLATLSLGPLTRRPPAPISLDVLFPLIIRDPQTGELRYPQRLIFPLTVQIVMERDERKVDRDIRKIVPTVQSVTTFLTPQTFAESATPPEAPRVNAQNALPKTLQMFAERFEEALPGLHLAAGQERIRNNPNTTKADKQIEKPLWAVHFGNAGILYNIREGAPFFFAPAPLARTLLSGTAKVAAYNSGTGLQPESEWEDRRVEAIDLNVLARNFLLAVEDFLRPESLVAARAINADAVRAILGHKKTLADAIQGQVTHILVSNDQADLTARRQAAVGVLREHLLVNLVEGYDIETIVVFDVEVGLPSNSGGTSANRVRLYGQPFVSRVKQQGSSVGAATPTVDFHLSPAKIPLTPETSHVAFLFDTKTPEKYEDIQLELVYRLNQIECDIVPLGEGLAQEASSFLSFVLPIDDEPDNSMGEIAIPIPLRTYPIPPSLVFQRAEFDPDSLKRLQDVRQWQYRYTYEHLDIAQDTIQTSVQYNVLPPSSETRGGEAQSSEALFSALVNFTVVYPLLAADLLLLRQDVPERDPAVLGPALNALNQLIGKVAVTWQARRPSADAAEVAQYQIDEMLTAAGKTVTISVSAHDPMPAFPNILLPGFSQSGGPVPDTDDGKNTVTFTFTPMSREEAALDPVHGESSIPDRTLVIPDLDILRQQNAWATVWLERNKELVVRTQTNPAFIMATPQVRFSNAVTPLIINDERWDVAILGSTDGTRKTRSLDKHLLRLFGTLLPEESDKPYNIRVSVCYAFALATGDQASAGSDLVVRLPVLLQPRFTVLANQNILEATGQLRKDLVDGINAWKHRHHPETRNAMYIFGVSIFSHPDPRASQENSLPLLRIDQLRLQLENVE